MKDNILTVEEVISTFKGNPDIIIDEQPDNQGRRSIYIKEKHQGKLSGRRYGISWQIFVRKSWNTMKFIQLDDIKTYVDKLLSGETHENINLKIKTIKTRPVSSQQKHQSIDASFKHMIPRGIQYIPRKIETNTTDYKAFEKAIQQQQEKNILLIGPTGSGKTTMVRYYCADYKRPYARVSLNGGATIEDLVGHYILKDNETKWIDGILTQAVRNGWVIVIDEINAAPSEILFILNPLLDDERILILSSKDGEVVHAHPDFRLIATCNPTEQGYAGTKEINEALLDRFHRIFYLDYNTKVEEKILKKIGVETHLINCIMNFTSKVRKSYTEGEIITPFSTRCVINLAELIQTDQTRLIINRFRTSERTIISDLIDVLINETKDIIIDKPDYDDEGEKL